MPIMRFAPLLAAATLACLLLSGTAPAAAGAYPIRDRALTGNKLYGTGELQQSDCPERDIKPNDVAAAKRYLTAVLDCLNRSWGAHFKRAGLPFTKAKIGFITKPRKYCGSAWGAAAATYCDAERRFIVLLERDLLEDTSDLFLFRLAAHEYGHHVQYLTGIGRAHDRYPYRNKSELNEQIRRFELQAECLGGVFIGSVWDSLQERSEEDWDILLQIMRESGDEQSKVRDHGKGRNIAAWLGKGFRATSPKTCNTWTTSSAKVS
ncbi:neutral zinc metallopeptidase [Nonomuraea basaltis]|uniref:neutral zinc metallopeptidase n=1 Tax=Nonomuraea basaltis TaxID=2495887 RepID=UPI00110C47E7|nr:neutral zinc metallopeptidase [Nonomuraea basaltis]TMR94763.1 metalloprotease-like protein [Nonomuraea basaltis]